MTETEPVDFFVYADVDEFYDALGPGAHENVAGSAYANIRTLLGLIPPDQIDDPQVAVRIPHEFVHLVFDTASKNPYHSPPRWLNEGLAVYQSEGYGSSDRGQVEAAARSGTLIPLDGLTGQFPNGNDFFLAYAESVAAVDYMVRTYGSDALVSLVRSYADGRTDDEAFTAALGLDMTAFSDGLVQERQRDAEAEVRTAAGAGRPGPVGVDRRRARWRGRVGRAGRPGCTRPRPSAAPAPVRASPASEPALPGWLVLGLVAVVIGVVGLALLVVLGRRRPGGDARDRDAVGSGRSRAGRSPSASPSWRSASWSPRSSRRRARASSYTTQERTPLVETANELQAQQDELKARILDLRGEDPDDRDAGRGLGRPRPPAERASSSRRASRPG